MNVLAVYSIKGGVGKTVTSVNLAHLAAASGLRTLLCDLDPQGSSSFYFRVKPRIKGGARRLFKGKSDAGASIKGTDYEGLDILPADFSYRNADLILREVSGSKKKVRQILGPLLGSYDFVLIDCPPNITLLSEAIFKASSYLAVPVIPTPLSLNTLKQLRGFFREKNMSRKKLLPFFSMVERNKKLHQEVSSAGRHTIKNLLTAEIPYLAQIERMGIHREPVTAFAPASAAAEAYKKLWLEIYEILKGPPRFT